MPRPSKASLSLLRGPTLGLLLVVLGSTSIPASAGPISDRVKQWSMQRQSQSRVEKPFSGQSGSVEINGASMTQKLRQRLTSRGKENTTTHQFKTQKFEHANGTLVR